MNRALILYASTKTIGSELIKFNERGTEAGKSRGRWVRRTHQCLARDCSGRASCHYAIFPESAAQTMAASEK